MTIREVSDETQSAGTFSPSATPAPVQVRCDDGSQYGSAAPCNNLRSFAEHNVAPRGAAGTAFEFDVLWTPPPNEVGKLHVYVAAVAGDGSGGPQGDWVYTSMQTIANAGKCTDITNPILRTTENGGSFQPPLSSNAMVSILGTGFVVGGPGRIAGLGDFVNGAFPTELSCVSVQVTGPGVSPTLIPISYVSATQINAQLPTFSGTGPVTLQLILNPGQTNQSTSYIDTYTTLQPFAPAFFLFANSISIAAQFAGTANIVADPSLIPGATPAKPGDIVTLYGTGFGDTNPSVAAGQLATGQAPLLNGVTVTIGTATLAPSDVLYAGLSPGSISGLYQFDVRIPQSTPSGEIPVPFPSEVPRPRRRPPFPSRYRNRRPPKSFSATLFQPCRKSGCAPQNAGLRRPRTAGTAARRSRCSPRWDWLDWRRCSCLPAARTGNRQREHALDGDVQIEVERIAVRVHRARQPGRSGPESKMETR